MFCQTLKSAFIHKIFQHGCVLSAKPVFLLSKMLLYRELPEQKIPRSGSRYTEKTGFSVSAEPFRQVLSVYCKHFGKYFTPPLTTCGFDHFLLTDQLWKILEYRLDHPGARGADIIKSIPPVLKIRESSASDGK